MNDARSGQCKGPMERKEPKGNGISARFLRFRLFQFPSPFLHKPPIDPSPGMSVSSTTRWWTRPELTVASSLSRVAFCLRLAADVSQT